MEPRPAPAPPPRRVLTPSQLNAEAQVVLEESFGVVWLEGEVSNLARPRSGHWYFTLKDRTAQVRCAMFRNRNIRVRFRPEDGMHLLVRGRVSLYVGRGEFQLLVDSMEPAGEGALRLAFDQLRRRLEAEGLFAAEAKRALPAHPRHVAVLTSPTGAAIRDVLSVLERRWPLTRVTLIPTAVQGEAATSELVAAFDRLARWLRDGGDASLVIAGRGGGSLEDLWCFNEEAVARAIADCPIPVVAAVGHETDFTIADFVADLRAPTPSAAAELVTPDAGEWQQTFAATGRELASAARRLLRSRRERLRHLERRLRHPGHLLRERTQRLDGIEIRLERHLHHLLVLTRERVSGLSGRLEAAGPRTRLRRERVTLVTLRRRLLRLGPEPGRRQAEVTALARRLTRAERRRLSAISEHVAALQARLDLAGPSARLARHRGELERLQRRLLRTEPRPRLQRCAAMVAGLARRLQRSGTARVETARAQLDHAGQRLSAYNPLAVVDRGYALLMRPPRGDARFGELVRAPEEVEDGEVLVARLAGGTLGLRVDATAATDEPQEPTGR